MTRQEEAGVVGPQRAEATSLQRPLGGREHGIIESVNAAQVCNTEERPDVKLEACRM